VSVETDKVSLDRRGYIRRNSKSGESVLLGFLLTAVQPIGERNVNSLDLGIRQQGLVTPITLGDPILFRRTLSGLCITRSDGDDLCAGVRSGWVEERGRVDHRRREHSDFYCDGGFGDFLGREAFVPVLVEESEGLTYLRDNVSLASDM
jgi:hypothetical protein